MSDATVVERLAEVIDDQAIRRVLTIYSQLLDDCRWDEWADLFTEDAVFSALGFTFVGRDAIRRGISDMTPAMPGKHVAFATAIDLDRDRALAWTDFVALADAGPGAWGRSYNVATAARYYDRLIRVDGRWRFERREVRAPDAPLPDGAAATPMC